MLNVANKLYIDVILDVNECLGNFNGGCEDICLNTHGSFHCSCDTNRALMADGFSCSGWFFIEDWHNKRMFCYNNNYLITHQYFCNWNTSNQFEQPVFSIFNLFRAVYCFKYNQLTTSLVLFSFSMFEMFVSKNNHMCAKWQSNIFFRCILFTGGNKSEERSVFSIYGIINQLLPRGCHTIFLKRCTDGNNASILLSSTTPWYKLNKDQHRVFTQGIVFVEVSAVALPVSLTGVVILDSQNSFEIVTESGSLNPADGISYGEKRTNSCLSFLPSSKNIRDFLLQNSFTATVFSQLEKVLPNWLKFYKSNRMVLGISDLTTSLQRGTEVQKGLCKGAPLFSERLYSVFKFGTEFGLSVYGQQIVVPAPLNNKKFCIIVDVCQDYGGSIFLILPEESRDLLDSLTIFKTLSDQHGLKLLPRGLGISLLRHINVHSETKSLQMWNGDELFQYS